MSGIAVVFVFFAIAAVSGAGLTLAEIIVIETIVFAENATWYFGSIVSRRLNIFCADKWVALFIYQAEVGAAGL